MRVISEIDDHGEAYPASWQGPDVNALLRVPAGRFVLSFYEWNYDGHDGGCARRDYPVAVQTFPPKWHYSLYWTRDGAIAAKCYSKPSRVIARAEQNWGGEWIRFLVRGPVVIGVRFCRNYSLNTHVLGAALDYFNEFPPPYYYGRRSWNAHLVEASQRRRTFAAEIASAPARAAGAASLACEEETLAYRSPVDWAATGDLVYAGVLRALAGGAEPVAKDRSVAARVEYRLALFNRWQAAERKLGTITPASVEGAIRWNHLNFNYGYFAYGVVRREAKKLSPRRRQGGTW